MVEDDAIYLVQLESMLARLDNCEQVGSSNSYASAIKEINKSNPDIIIADIRLEGEHSGIDLAEELHNKAIAFIFVTAFSDEAVYKACKKYLCSKFIVKPFDVLTLKGLIDDISENIIKLSSTQIIKDDSLFIRKNNVFEKISIKDLDYFYSEGNYITFFMMTKKFVLKYSLSKLLKLNKFDSFVRVHRSYAVHKNKVDTVNFSDKLLSVAGMQIPFGRTYAKDVRKLMNLRLK